MGISVWKDDYIHLEEYKFNSYHEFYWHLQDLYLRFKPSLILIPYPTRFYNVIVAHAKQMGLVCLLADKKDIPVIEVNDKQCKKVVLGNGKAKKGEVMDFFNQESEHIADSMCFVEWYLKTG